ncbi:MAG: phytanoyl-CoA dioxygenase family protein [Ilumatobacteraceae bacterium]
MRGLTPATIDRWRSDGFLHIEGHLDGPALTHLRERTDRLAELGDGESGVLQHYERTESGVRICRSEHLLEFDPDMREVIIGEVMLSIASRLLGEPAVLYKEKVNYKLAGGAGFAPHQDAPAYPFIDTHLTCMVAIDDATEANGCLEMVRGMHGEILPMDDDGCIRPDVVSSMEWVSVPVRAGDLLWFHSRAPHRSAANRSDADRRALFCTYNAAAEGDLRSRYYEEKFHRFSERHEGKRTRVSLIGDFQGVAPTAREIAEYRGERQQQ